MSKIGLIMGREIKSKLSNKTFIVMTLLAPLLITGFLGLIIKMSMDDKTEQRVLVIDDSHAIADKLVGNDYTSFATSNEKLDEAQLSFSEKNYTCLLYIFPGVLNSSKGQVKIFYKKSPGLFFQESLKNQIEKIIYEGQLKSNNIDVNVINNAKTSVNLITQKIDDKGFNKDDSHFGFLGFIIGALMFMFILMYGMMVFRSVMEEKTNRIVEVIVSSVKPFELMLGKIFGVAVLGILQFCAMGIVTFVLTTILSTFFMKDLNTQFDKFTQQQELVKKNGTNVDFKKLTNFSDKVETFEIMKKIKGINIPLLLITFVLYFVGGYLFYSSIMAAIGSAVDSESDSQQFITPVMIPLMIGYFIATKTITNPDSSIVFWGSIIPFTSPIVMMSRINDNTPVWEIALSLGLLYISFIFTTFLAGKIYRTGILMYGKKTSWKEIGKWLFYK